MSGPLKGFIAYSHKDTEAKDELRMCLAVMKQQNKLVTWHDGDITGGGKARQEHLLKEVADSDILLYLVSAASLDSENCNKELAEALGAEIRIIPIILESCDWLNHQLSDFQALPDKGKPINEWNPESRGWQDVVDSIRKAVEEMQDRVQKGALPEWIFQQGNFLLRLGQMDKAIEAYLHALKLNLNNASTYNNRGVAYNIKGESDRAIADYTKAIQLKQGYADAYYNRGVAWLHLGKWEKARADLTDAKNMGVDIITAFHFFYESIKAYEQRNRIKLPGDIAEMLTVSDVRDKEVPEATHELSNDAEITETLESQPTGKNPMAQRIIEAVEQSYDVTMEDAEALLQVIKENQMPVRFDSPFGANEQEN